MNWLIFIMVVAHDGTYVGYEGAPIAATDSEDTCQMIGSAVAESLTTTSIINDMGVMFDYRCVFDGASA